MDHTEATFLYLIKFFTRAEPAILRFDRIAINDFVCFYFHVACAAVVNAVFRVEKLKCGVDIPERIRQKRTFHGLLPKGSGVVVVNT